MLQNSVSPVLDFAQNQEFADFMSEMEKEAMQHTERALHSVSDTDLYASHVA